MVVFPPFFVFPPRIRRDYQHVTVNYTPSLCAARYLPLDLFYRGVCDSFMFVLKIEHIVYLNIDYRLLLHTLF